jgi:SagB-type dehydrogenase family enzyme
VTSARRWFPYILAAIALSISAAGLAQDAPGAEIVLPDIAATGDISLEAAIAARRSVREFADTPLTWAQIGQLAWAAQGITDTDSGFRTAPSAGGLYPLEVYLATPDGLYQYLPAEHKLVRLSEGDPRPRLRDAGGQDAILQAPLTIILAAVFERTQARFGERADVYVYMEAGHAAQNVLLQAVALGLGSVPMGGLAPDRVAEALSLPDDHQPLYIMPVGHPPAPQE